MARTRATCFLTRGNHTRSFLHDIVAVVREPTGIVPIDPCEDGEELSQPRPEHAAVAALTAKARGTDNDVCGQELVDPSHSPFLYQLAWFVNCLTKLTKLRIPCKLQIWAFECMR